MCRTIGYYKLRVDFNLVAYNPPEGEDPSLFDLEHARDIVLCIMPSQTQVNVVPRIGPDAYVSCGMFFSEGKI